jgi:hypothetical protein
MLLSLICPRRRWSRSMGEKPAVAAARRAGADPLQILESLLQGWCSQGGLE